MTTITVYQSGTGEYKGFTCSGHAGFAEAGSDIVCAAISILVINTINSIEQFGKQAFTCEQDQESGMIRFALQDMPTKETKLLLDSMILGLKEVEKQYHRKYLKLHFKEV
ncbi:MAG: ribosomal-processing cysteine protease Prp [Lachnospiraceae bacterium]|nr:ribosomal-processing cysteine protease Prp [Lachnospiraceae bacterium]